MLRWLLTWAMVSCSLGASAQSVDIPPELWDRPRTARFVLDHENIRRAINVGLEKPDAQIVIHHGAGQEALVQAEELKSWLTALAIDSRRIMLRADAGPGSAMRLEIVQ